MKKICLLVLGAFIALATSAQRTQLGLKGGLNIANFKDESFGTDSKLGFHVGGLAHIHLSRVWALQPEIVFSSQGAEYSFQTTKLNYVNLPIVLQYMTPTGFRIQTGPQLGIRAMHEIETNEGVELDRDVQVNKTDFSWTVGASYLTRSRLGFDARYNHGISDITKGDPGYEARNRVWQVGVFYQFKHQ